MKLDRLPRSPSSVSGVRPAEKIIGTLSRDAFITAAARCAPPGNKPTPEELRNCRPFFERELDLLTNVRVVVALGKIAFDTYLDVLKARGAIRSRAPFVFGHDREFTTAPGLPVLISSYHPSQQNTSTGKLTEKMLVDVFKRARKRAETAPGPVPSPLRPSAPGPRAERPPRRGASR